jgi:hypothetical protein
MGKRIYNLEDCIKIAKDNDGYCLQNYYKSTKEMMRWKCKHGHEWDNIFKEIKKGKWCPYCNYGKHTIDECISLAKGRNGECLSTSYIDTKTKMTWKCNVCNYKWEACFKSILSGRWCASCVGNIKLTIDDCYNTAKENNGECLSDVYINKDSKMCWKCNECGCEWVTTYGAIRNGTWCPDCSTGKSQRQLKKILDEMFGYQSVTIRPDWLKNPETGRNLEIDIYFPKLKLAVEYQGKQHYEPVEYFGGIISFERVKKYDEMKRNMIKRAKKYVLYYIEFPYTEKITYHNVKRFISNKVDLQILTCNDSHT